MPIQRNPHEDRDRQRQLAALEALFAPKKPAPPPGPPSTRSAAKIVARSASPKEDPERDRLVARLLAAEGANAVLRATSALERAGFSVPEDQETSLRMLEHPEEARVRRAIAALGRLLEDAAPKRRAVLDARLARIAELAEEAETRDAATALRRRALRGLA